ncbi:MAG: thioredoxin family protein [Candidatus Eisenbacteria bacterium]|nr:thioredoxin family protein [Candidatus Eisenbacteria bacterium]
MKLQVLGPGCPKCKKLAENVEAAVKELGKEPGNEPGAEAQVTKITDIDEIVKFGVMMTPGLVIDGKLKSSGRILNVEEIKKLIREARPGTGNA